jgi:hypothetical protein
MMNHPEKQKEIDDVETGGSFAFKSKGNERREYVQ